MFDVERLVQWVFGAPAVETPTAVVFALWPAGGRQALGDALEALEGVAVFHDSEAFSGAIASPPEPGTVPVLVSLGRPDLGVHPVRVVPGDVLRLNRAEMERWLEHDVEAVGDLDALVRVTDGWIGPFLRLKDEDDPEAAVASEAFRRWVDEQILGPLPPATRKVVDELVAALGADDAVDPELWRRHFLDRPDRLAAFEALRHRWGLLVPTPDGLRLPKLLMDARRSAVDEASPIRRALAGAALALDRSAEAGAWLRRAGDATEARRVEALDGHLTVPGAIDLRLLGPPAVAKVGADGVAREVDWRLRRAFHLVALLALAPDRRATRDELVAQLFPDASRAAVERNFHPTVSDARRTLGLAGSTRGGIVHRDGVYRLDPSVRWQLDCDRFLAAAERAEQFARKAQDLDLEVDEDLASTTLNLVRGKALDCAIDAWGLYRGPLLDGHDAPWIGAARDRLHRRYLDTLRRAAGLAERLDRPTLALDAWRTVLVHEPFEESAHLEVMSLYAAQGRRDLVRRQFVRLQDLLKELRIGPADETVSRYHALMR